MTTVAQNAVESEQLQGSTDAEVLRSILGGSGQLSAAQIEGAIQLIQGAGFERPQEPVLEYGWAPHAHSREKFATQTEAEDAYYMAIGHPVRRWQREHRTHNGWVLAEDSP